MNLHKEIKFEAEICDHLGENGWLHAENDAKDYDRARALFPADVLAWVQTAQPQAWDALTKPTEPTPPRRCSRDCGTNWTSAAPWTCSATASSCWASSSR